MNRKRNLRNTGAASLFVLAGLSATSAVAWEVPGCRLAWDDLAAQNALENVAVLIKKDCPVMYRKGWLLSRSEGKEGTEVPGCRGAWNALVTKHALSNAKTLVTHNCPVIYRRGWR